WTRPIVTTPPSWPPSTASRRIGVSVRRLRNPVWMSRARSVPAFIVANSAPWMKGTASAKATNEVVGKPGSRVSALSPPALTASSSIGNSSGEITFAGWRAVRTTERRANRKTWSANAFTSGRFHGQPAARSLFFLLCGSLERPAGLGEEDVVQRRLVQLQVLDLEVLRVERANEPGQVGLARLEPDGDAAFGAAGLAEAGEDRSRPVAVGRVGGLGQADAVEQLVGSGLPGLAR